MSSFGPTLLSKVLGLNDVQESSLGLVFHYADTAGLPLLDLEDLRAVLTHLTSDEGKAELKDIGGLSAATVGVILRSLITFSDQGADAFFGEPEFDTADLLRVTGDGRGVVSLLELPNLQDRPAVFSTFLMWLLADLFHDLPEVGDVDKPKLVFFFDEAHLLFADASKAFLDRDRADRPADPVQGRRHLLRHPDARRTSPTTCWPSSARGCSTSCGRTRRTTPRRSSRRWRPSRRRHYDLAEVLQQLGIGEAIVTVMDPDGAPTPVAWTRMMRAAVADGADAGGRAPAGRRRSRR